MINAHFPQNDSGIKIAAGSISAEEITADIADLFPPREQMNPDPTTEEWDNQIRELTHKLAETAEDRDRLREKVIDLTTANESMAREIAAYEDRVQRLIAQVENLENHLDAKADEIFRLKAKLWDCVAITGYLPEEC